MYTMHNSTPWFFVLFFSFNFVHPDINIVYPILALSARKDAIINLNANVFVDRPYFMDKKHLEFKMLDLNCFDLHIFVND